MKFRRPRGDHDAALRTGTALLCGTGLAGVLFGNLMVPSYGAGDLAAQGIPAWQVVMLAGIANLAVAASGVFLALTGRQPRWPWVAGAMAFAAAGLLVPVLLPVASGKFVLLAGSALAVFGLGAGFAQLTEQTAAVAGVAEDKRSAAVGTIMRWHLLGGVLFGGLPFLHSWQAGQVALAVTFGLLALFVAARRRVPDAARRERYGLRRLIRETGPGSLIVATGQVAWVVMYLLPGLLEMSAGWIAAYAVIAQLVAALAMKQLGAVADRNRQRAARISGIALLLAIVGVGILPAVIANGLGIWVGLACFVAGEVSANFFITAIEGLISVETGGQRAQLLGHAMKFAAVGVAGGLVAIGSGALHAQLGSASAAMALGGIIFAVLGAMLVASFSALRARRRPEA